MKKRMIPGSLAMAAALAAPMLSSVHAAGAQTAKPSSAHTSDVAFTVYEHKDATEAYNPGKPGGYVVFADSLYDSQDAHIVGTSAGQCTYVSTSAMECMWDLIFSDASKLSIQGAAVNQSPNQSYAITGGTGKYSQASGTLYSNTKHTSKGTEYEYTIQATVPSNSVTPYNKK